MYNGSSRQSLGQVSTVFPKIIGQKEAYTVNLLSQEKHKEQNNHAHHSYYELLLKSQ